MAAIKNSSAPPSTKNSYQGMRAFYILWVGQFVSIFATRMTNFALTLWAWKLTGTATGLVMVGVITFIPGVILSPFAGTLIDRWNRKLVLALSDAGAALATLILLYLFTTDQAEIWHLYATGALSSVFGAFQYPAYSAVVTTMVPKEQYARANGMRSVVGSASGIAAPLLAGTLLAVVDIPVIMVIDLITFGIALFTLMIVFIPQPRPSEEAQIGKGSVWAETMHGFRYILNRKSLIAIFLLFTLSNIHASFGYPLMSPMILSKTGDNSTILGMSQSAGSVGFLVGGLIMSFWGGPRKRIHMINMSFILWGLFGAFIYGSAWSIPFWLLGSFLMAVFNPIINSAYIAILQAKVEPDLQGRIFGIEYAISTVSYPLGQLVAGWLADNIFEPALMPGGSLSNTLGSVLGTGPGAGIGFVIIIGGGMAIFNGLLGYLVKPIRQIETLLPDHGMGGEK
ncbi:MAG: MFS transporter [Anaerolineales bacterium]|uniref:MFS transporter n=1 Tax=Candidatus Desulfolinea nitratireducens TaxID=2841698 RepID=A0A8J6TIL9_9CHLR|nr:MFS transporter [Candidatus Desulfolinea nitratireducens]MBL6961382.1 MFS transporter [Anaerolineales bacterium]